MYYAGSNLLLASVPEKNYLVRHVQVTFHLFKCIERNTHSERAHVFALFVRFEQKEDRFRDHHIKMPRRRIIGREFLALKHGYNLRGVAYKCSA